MRGGNAARHWQDSRLTLVRYSCDKTGRFSHLQLSHNMSHYCLLSHFGLIGRQTLVSHFSLFLTCKGFEAPAMICDYFERTSNLWFSCLEHLNESLISTTSELISATHARKLRTHADFENIHGCHSQFVAMGAQFRRSYMYWKIADRKTSSVDPVHAFFYPNIKFYVMGRTDLSKQCRPGSAYSCTEKKTSCSCVRTITGSMLGVQFPDF